MSHSTKSRVRFGAPLPMPLEATFDAGRLTSDGGLSWLARADQTLAVCAAVAACLPEWRWRAVRHSLADLIRQRVYQIACGYADQNDADSLRHDPLLKLVCGRLPESGRGLASQPTFARLENAVDRRAIAAMATVLVDIYLRERGRSGAPKRILSDLDGTDDPAHGQQESVAYHGYYRQHMYHPLLVSDGDTGQLSTAILRPGNAHASRFVVLVLRRLVARRRQVWPGVRITLRADSGFATPRLYAWCEREGIGYTSGLGTNPRLATLAAPQLAAAQAQSDAQGGAKVRRIGEATYQAGSWSSPRRLVFKTEILEKGPNVRFVVTSEPHTVPPLAVYDAYVARGAAENGPIQGFKVALPADRLSDQRFWANHYWLLDT